MARKAEYGRGHKAFLDYVHFIVEHPNYAGMPDIFMDNGDIQWEAPSNRQGGKFKDTHHRRRDWWRAKATEIGIDPSAPHWISRTAKAVHPTKKKPCKNCGRVMDIRYTYPSAVLLRRIAGLPYIDESFPRDPLEHILDLVTRLVEQFGDRVFGSLPSLLAASSIEVPALPPELDNWLTWIENEYIESEPSTLSPGAMSNAPDRLDGFHSFNLCCRSKTDPGRSRENLQSYTTDRRVFEYWVEGDWVAADRLMGAIRSDDAMKMERCLNDHSGPCSADHIGPISLGFMHRPQFQLLCKNCNSAKNNRMLFRDVRHLMRVGESGEDVASWYCRSLWELRKGSVHDNETALRLSKLLRDNRHTFMRLLERIADAGHFVFLTTFLGLKYARKNVEFVNLGVEDHITRFDDLVYTDRVTKYAVEQQARRLRVAFAALREYVQKETRNAFVISTDETEQLIRDALCELNGSPAQIKRLDQELREVLSQEVPSEENLRSLAKKLDGIGNGPAQFAMAGRKLQRAMDLVAAELAGLWDDERYVRAPLEEF